MEAWGAAGAVCAAGVVDTASAFFVQVLHHHKRVTCHQKAMPRLLLISLWVPRDNDSNDVGRCCGVLVTIPALRGFSPYPAESKILT